MFSMKRVWKSMNGMKWWGFYHFSSNFRFILRWILVLNIQVSVFIFVLHYNHHILLFQKKNTNVCNIRYCAHQKFTKEVVFFIHNNSALAVVALEINSTLKAQQYISSLENFFSYIEISINPLFYPVVIQIS